MGKHEITIYTCDRCGAKIKDVKHVGTFHFMHVFKWYVAYPSIAHYTMEYICQDCFNSFKEWYKKDGDGKHDS